MIDRFCPANGVVHCEDVPLPDLARAVGTPVYVYSTAAMRGAAAALKAALAPVGDTLIAYAVKANPNPAVLVTLAAEGLGADVVSGGEYRRALAAGIAPHHIVFSGVGKTAAEMALALERGLYQFNVESVEEAEMLSDIAQRMRRVAPVALRVNPDVAAGSHEKISTGGARDKFGIPLSDAREACARIAALAGLNVQGVAVHIGSQLTSLAPLEAAFVKLGALIQDLRASGHDIRTADLGGGLGVAYDPAEAPPPTPQDYGAMVARITADWGVRLIFEPGRLIVGNAGVLLSEVIRVKPGAARPFVILDAAMNDLMRPSLYDAWHAIDAVAPTGDRMVADVVGPVCETGDTFARGRTIDRVGPGDLMIIRTAGAYAATMANMYNSRALTPEVLVDGARWAIVRARPDADAGTPGEMLPPWLEPAGITAALVSP